MVKGVKKCVTKKSIAFEDYKQCLEKGVDVHASQVLIQQKKAPNLHSKGKQARETEPMIRDLCRRIRSEH